MEKNNRRSSPGSYDMKIYTIPCNTFIVKLKLLFFQFAPMGGFRCFDRSTGFADRLSISETAFPSIIAVRSFSEGMFQFPGSHKSCSKRGQRGHSGTGHEAASGIWKPIRHEAIRRTTHNPN